MNAKNSNEKVHELKIHPERFNDIIAGRKKFELRKNDRDFKLFQLLKLREWDPKTKKYSGAGCTVRITYIVVGDAETKKMFGLMPGYVAMGITLL